MSAPGPPDDSTPEDADASGTPSTPGEPAESFGGSDAPEPSSEDTFEADSEWLAQIRRQALEGDQPDELTAGADGDVMDQVRRAVAGAPPAQRQPGPAQDPPVTPEAPAPRQTPGGLPPPSPPATGPTPGAAVGPQRPASAPRWEPPPRLDAGSRIGAPPAQHPAERAERGGRIGWWWTLVAGAVVAGGMWVLFVRGGDADPIPTEGSTPVDGTAPSEDSRPADSQPADETVPGEGSLPGEESVPTEVSQPTPATTETTKPTEETRRRTRPTEETKPRRDRGGETTRTTAKRGGDRQDREGRRDRDRRGDS